MKLTTRTIENIKTSIIVVLSLSTMLLLYFFWYQTPYEEFKNTEDPFIKDKIDAKELIVMEEVIVSFGEENFSVINFELSKIWYNQDSEEYSILDEFKKFSESEDIYVEEISETKYNEAKEFRHLEASFGYSLPFRELCEAYDIKLPNSYSSIESLTTIMYSEGRKADMFICDKIKGKYYWLFSDKDVTTFSESIEVIEESQYNTYFPMGAFLDSKNDTLIPASLEMNNVSFSYDQEVYVDDEDSINSIAKKYFGDNFDFIRKITEDSGKIVYMYGYGEKVFVVNVDGSMEYREKFNPDKYVDKTFFESLQIATNFISINGGFKPLNGTEMKPYLKGATTLQDKSSFTFSFGEIISDRELSYESGETIKVEVRGGQVVSCERDMIEYDFDDMLSKEKESETQTLHAINMLTQNQDYIYEAMIATDSYADESLEASGLPSFEEIASRISKVKTGYVRDEETKTIKPAWILTAGNAKIFVDLYDYSSISYTKVVE